MSAITIAGDTSGSITLDAPAVAGSNTLTLPAATGTVIYSNASGNLLFNSGYGSVATAYGCRAWVNFNGNGTVSIRASGNVTSITDNGTGNYTVNFTTAMSDANYATIATDLAGDPSYLNSVEVKEGTTPTTTSVNLIANSVRDGGGTFIGRDMPAIYCAIFR
jgi:hypothetical protein